MNTADQLRKIQSEIADINRRLIGARKGLVSLEGTSILSTGELGASKYLREDGDNSCSWQTPPGGTSGQFLDNFSDAARYWAWKDLTPVGTITETGGYCQISIPAATAGNWWGVGLEQCPRAYLGSMTVPQEVITKLTVQTLNVNTKAGMFISNNPLLGGNSGYTLARNDAGIIQSVQLGVGTLAQTGGAIALPVWLRIRTVAEGNGNTTYFAYSTDGITYVALGNVVNLTHRAVGLYTKNWTNNAIDARFDFFSITMDSGPG